MNKRGEWGLSIIFVVFLVILGLVWVFGSFKPILEYNIGAIIAPIVFSQLVQLVVNYDFKSPFFAIIVGVIALVFFTILSVGWVWSIFACGFIGNAILLIGMVFDDKKNFPGATSGYTFFFMMVGLVVSIILATLLVV